MMIAESSTLDPAYIDQMFAWSRYEPSTAVEHISNRIDKKEEQDSSRPFRLPSECESCTGKSRQGLELQGEGTELLGHFMGAMAVDLLFGLITFSCRLRDRLSRWLSRTESCTDLMVTHEGLESDRAVALNRTQEIDSSSTSVASEVDLSAVVKQEIQNIFRVAKEIPESEAEQVLARYLSASIRKYEILAVTEVQNAILSEQMTPDSAEAALRILGDIDHQSTHVDRRGLLEKALTDCSSPIVRDGANVGLSYMDDPHAITSLKSAIGNEKNPLVRKLMRKTLAQLEEL